MTSTDPPGIRPRVRTRGILVGVLLHFPLLQACGSYSRVGRYQDASLDVPVEVALKSTVLGMTPFRMTRDLQVICVGRVRRPNRREADEESARARMRWEARLARMVEGAAPVVVPASACYRSDTGEYLHRATGARAIQTTVSAPPIEDGYVDITVGNEIGGGMVGGSMWYRLVQDAEGWWVRDQECRGGIFCSEFDFAQILEGIPRDGNPEIGR